MTENALASEVPQRVRRLMPKVMRQVNAFADEQEREMEQELEQERHTQRAKPPRPATPRVSKGLADLRQKLNRGETFDFDVEGHEPSDDPREFIPLRDALKEIGVFCDGGLCDQTDEQHCFPSTFTFVTRGFLTTIMSQCRKFQNQQNEEDQGLQLRDLKSVTSVSKQTRKDGHVPEEATRHAFLSSTSRGFAYSMNLCTLSSTAVMKVPQFVVRFRRKKQSETESDVLLLVSNLEAERVFVNSSNLRLFCTISRTDQDAGCLQDRMPSLPTVVVKTSVSANTATATGTKNLSRSIKTSVPVGAATATAAPATISSTQQSRSKNGASTSKASATSSSALAHRMTMELTHLVPLHAFAGSVYADDAVLRQLLHYFGLVRRDSSQFHRWAEPKDEKSQPLVSKDGFVFEGKARSKDGELFEYRHCEYKVSPVAFLRRFYSQVRYLQTELSTSSLGSVLQCSLGST
ncbi:unnamed protein product [Amoebophrya sp. A25]|nr:unnamed protein product [Amoebophrya sp. A25]|eukprot:GSA25T00011910001.1